LISAYRFAFNGKENDDEAYGDDNQQDYGMRIYDPRLGRFLSVDPIAAEYPWYTPYQFSGNKPIWAVDLDGLEEKPSHTWNLENTVPKIDPDPTDIQSQQFVFESYHRGRGNNQPYIYKYKNQNGESREYTDSPIGNTSMFKYGFDNYLPKRFLDHYSLGNGELYQLTTQEAEDIHAAPVGLQANNIPGLGDLKVGESANVSGSVITGANVSGTLGNFPVEYKGVVTKTSEGWSFKGQIRLTDLWDFDPRGPGTGRPPGAEALVRLANLALAGTPFPIVSEWFETTQKSSEGSFKWFQGKSQTPIPNRVMGGRETAPDTKDLGSEDHKN
jgi:RHS repeat-associated protein